MVKNSIVFALVFGIVCSGVTAQETVPVFSQDRIRTKAQALHAFMKKREPLVTAWSVAKGGLAGIGAIYAASCMLSLASYFLSDQKTYISAGPVATGDQTVAVRRSILSGLKTHIVDVLLPECGSYIVSTVGAFGMSYMFGAIEKNYGNHISLSWFVTRRASFYATIRCLRAVESDEVQFDNRESVMLFEKLVDQVESILAFMSHGEQSFKVDKKTLARQLRSRFKEQLEPLLADLRKNIDEGTVDQSYILDQIGTALERGCLRFSVLEGTHWIDPDLIFDMMQNASV
jgi:hypothetical protein